MLFRICSRRKKRRTIGLAAQKSVPVLARVETKSLSLRREAIDHTSRSCLMRFDEGFGIEFPEARSRNLEQASGLRSSRMFFAAIDVCVLLSRNFSAGI